MAFDLPLADRVRRAQAGDVRAFEQLFQEYHRAIYHAIFQMIRHEADAADLTQEVFLRAYQALPRLQAPDAFPRWLYCIAVNLGRNWLRDHGRARIESLEAPAEEGCATETREIADSSGDPATLLETREMQQRVRGAVAGLSPDHRLVVTLHHLRDMPVEEIARVLGWPVGTVKSRLSRAREHLKRKLAGYVEGER